MHKNFFPPKSPLRPATVFVALLALMACDSSIGDTVAPNERPEQTNASAPTEPETNANAEETADPQPSNSNAGDSMELQIEELAGGSVVTNLGYGIAINKGSTLKRSFYVFNDPGCPVQLQGAGVSTRYNDRNYSFVPKGELRAEEPVAAVEIRFLLFDVWGEHLKTLSATEIKDLGVGTSLEIKEIGTWQAWENDVSRYLTSVAFVSRVRTLDGKGWTANTSALLQRAAELDLKPDESDLDPKEKGSE